MDVESRDTIDEAIDRAKKVLDESLAQASLDLTGIGDRFLEEISNIVGGALKTSQDVIGKGINDVEELIKRLDGWTVDINIPTIQIKLNKPKE